MSLKAPFVFAPNSAATVYFVLKGQVTFNQAKQVVTDAVGTFTIYDPNGNPVAGAQNVSLSLQATPPGVPGLYQGSVDQTQFNPPYGEGYVTQIDFTSATYKPRRWRVPTIIKDLS